MRATIWIKWRHMTAIFVVDYYIFGQRIKGGAMSWYGIIRLDSGKFKIQNGSCLFPIVRILWCFHAAYFDESSVETALSNVKWDDLLQQCRFRFEWSQISGISISISIWEHVGRYSFANRQLLVNKPRWLKSKMLKKKDLM